MYGFELLNVCLNFNGHSYSVWLLTFLYKFDLLNELYCRLRIRKKYMKNCVEGNMKIMEIEFLHHIINIKFWKTLWLKKKKEKGQPANPTHPNPNYLGWVWLSWPLNIEPMWFKFCQPNYFGLVHIFPPIRLMYTSTCNNGNLTTIFLSKKTRLLCAHKAILHRSIKA